MKPPLDHRAVEAARRGARLHRHNLEANSASNPRRNLERKLGRSARRAGRAFKSRRELRDVVQAARADA